MGHKARSAAARQAHPRIRSGGDRREGLGADELRITGRAARIADVVAHATPPEIAAAVLRYAIGDTSGDGILDAAMARHGPDSIAPVASAVLQVWLVTGPTVAKEWLYSPNQSLNDTTPVGWLDGGGDPEWVLTAARSYLGTEASLEEGLATGDGLAWLDIPAH